MKQKILNPELEHELTMAGEEPVEVVFFLKTPRSGFLSPQRTREIVSKLVSKAESKASRKAESLSIFDKVQSFALKASAPVIQELANAKEVGSARLNKASGSFLIPPVKKQRVQLRKR